MTTTHATPPQVAIKFILKSVMSKNDYWKQHMHREVVIMKKLLHPNIIKVPPLRACLPCSPCRAQLLEVYETDQFIALVTEHAKCDLLSYLCTQGRMSEGKARTFARQLIAALEHMHALNIVHRCGPAPN